MLRKRALSVERVVSTAPPADSEALAAEGADSGAGGKDVVPVVDLRELECQRIDRPGIKNVILADQGDSCGGRSNRVTTRRKNYIFSCNQEEMSESSRIALGATGGIGSETALALSRRA